jgi:hypothetical protein
MAYATVSDVQARMSTTMDTTQQNICTNLLDDAAIIIDSFNANAPENTKKIVSIRMVQRALNVDSDIPLGATQGSMSALGYSQSWTMGSNTSAGELYLSKLEKELLGCGNKIGSKSPLEDLVRCSI